MKAILTLFLSLAATGVFAEMQGAKGTFEKRLDGRPRLAWELLKGYRLFFHPDDPEPLRRTLTVAIPTERKISRAYSLVRPLEPNLEFKDAWLRVEGEILNDRIQFSWDGTYAGAVFPDKKYYYEIHVRWADGEKLDQTVVIMKSLDHPRLAKVGPKNLEEHALEFKKGEFEASQIAATVSKSGNASLPIVAKVHAPFLEGAFHTEGVQLSYKYIEDLDGKPLLREKAWHCACQEPLPLDSPARQKAKKVRCDWDLSRLIPGVYELKLSLYHKMKHPGQFDPCDTPVLDEDRIRLRVAP